LGQRVSLSRHRSRTWTAIAWLIAGAFLATSALAADDASTGRRAGRAVKETSRDVGHATRDAAKTVGHTTRDVTRKIGHAFRDFFRELRRD
jgi:hypothetical protein